MVTSYLPFVGGTKLMLYLPWLSVLPVATDTGRPFTTLLTAMGSLDSTGYPGWALVSVPVILSFLPALATNVAGIFELLINGEAVGVNGFPWPSRYAATCACTVGEVM